MIKLMTLILENIFLGGGCFEFALALSKTFGYKLGTISGVFRDNDGDNPETDTYEIICHVFALHPHDSSLGIDFLGIRPIQDMIESAHFTEPPLKIIFKKNTSKEIGDEINIDDTIKSQALRFIKQNLNKFKV